MATGQQSPAGLSPTKLYSQADGRISEFPWGKSFVLSPWTLLPILCLHLLWLRPLYKLDIPIHGKASHQRWPAAGSLDWLLPGALPDAVAPAVGPDPCVGTECLRHLRQLLLPKGRRLKRNRLRLSLQQMWPGVAWASCKSFSYDGTLELLVLYLDVFTCVVDTYSSIWTAVNVATYETLCYSTV